MNKDKATGISILLASITLLVATVILPMTYMKGVHEENVAKAIEELTAKGVDPIAARCSMADSQDQLCVLYVATKQGAK